MTFMSRAIVALWAVGSSVHSAEPTWILAGQSNMRGGHSTYTGTLKELVSSKGHELSVVLSAKPMRKVAGQTDLPVIIQLGAATNYTQHGE